MGDLSRRAFVKWTVMTGAAVELGGVQAKGQSVPGTLATTQASANALAGAELHWLEGQAPALLTGNTWGVPWPRGVFKREQSFSLKNEKGEAVAVQSWPLAYWPDGSLKWTGHAMGPAEAPGDRFVLAPGSAAAPGHAVGVRETPEAVEVDTGIIRCRIPRRGPQLIEWIERAGRPVAQQGELICLRQDQTELPAEGAIQYARYTGQTAQVTVEQHGPVRAVVRVEGKHEGPGGRAWLPFTVRLYFYAGGEAVRIMHTFIFDGDEQKDFIRGLGVRFAVPMRDALHDRHVRFVGEEKGLWAEAIRGLTGLRRDPGPAARQAQLEGKATPPASTFPAAVRDRLEYIPAWGDYKLVQRSADGFEIYKRTKPGFGWIRANGGRRAAGVGYIGGASGGVAFGQRYFWQRHPAQLDIRNASTERAEVTIWLYSPEAPPMDLRFYHDTMGMETHAKELEGLEITYEDYEKEFGKPVGIARTNELTLWALAATPSREGLVNMADAVRLPGQLVCVPAQYLGARVFAGLWSLPDRSTPAKTAIENQLDFLVEDYKRQIEQNRWYGFWDHGDVMHTYDRDRHSWRYDVGGFAWDNSELSPDLWLWFTFLRSGRADVFRMAEAMTRHTGEVDVYHLGRFKGLGTRHGVQHWGDSAKQVRISTVVYRRFYYYLTADERVGDLMHELVDADQSFLTLDPIRKIRQGVFVPNPRAVPMNLGTDWGSMAAAWLTEWERTGEAKWRDKLLNGVNTIPTLPHGFYSEGGVFDPVTGKFTGPQGPDASASHLSAVFGLSEICAEIIQLADVPEFEKAWLQYCELYNAGGQEQQRVLGKSLGNLNLGEAHSRMTAYAAARRKDPQLAERAWREFYRGAAGLGVRNFRTQHLEGPVVLNPLDESPVGSTNSTAQWGITAIEILALIGEALPPEGYPGGRQPMGG